MWKMAGLAMSRSHQYDVFTCIIADPELLNECSMLPDAVCGFWPSGHPTESEEAFLQVWT